MTADAFVTQGAAKVLAAMYRPGSLGILWSQHQRVNMKGKEIFHVLIVICFFNCFRSSYINRRET